MKKISEEKSEKTERMIPAGKQPMALRQRGGTEVLEQEGAPTPEKPVSKAIELFETLREGFASKNPDAKADVVFAVMGPLLRKVMSGRPVSEKEVADAVTSGLESVVLVENDPEAGKFPDVKWTSIMQKRVDGLPIDQETKDAFARYVKELTLDQQELLTYKIMPLPFKDLQAWVESTVGAEPIQDSDIVEVAKS